MSSVATESWGGVSGHTAVIERFRRAYASGRMASTYLFVGPPGVGKRTFALRLAKALLCLESREGELAACGACQSCKLIEAGNHPDLLLVGRPEGRSFIPVETFIGGKERRMREGLCHDIAIKPFLGGRKVAVIDDADYLNAESANALLKTLEEPPPRSVLILIGTSIARQLPTIRSRCQVVRFEPLPQELIARLLSSQLEDADTRDCEALAALSGGSLQRAMQLTDPSLREFRGRLLEHLGKNAAPDSVLLSAEIGRLLEPAGRDTAARRARLQQVIEWTAEYYHQCLRSAAGMPPEGDSELAEAVRRAALPDPDALARCIGRCVEAAGYLERNANLSTLVQCWLEDLEQTCTAATVPPRG